jgi:site-specific DNA-methyltransferase (adenine-specific)
MELRLGRWQDVLADVTACDAVICDPPYGARTHDGNKERLEEMGRNPIGYGCWTTGTVSEFVGRLCARCRGWITAMTSDDLIPAWRDAYHALGRADFAPVPILAPRLRMSGVGPASSAVYLMTSRPRLRAFMSWGSLPGWYVTGIAKNVGVVGAKPLELMRDLVRDYSRPGDLVIDPCCGSGTTLLAAAIEGRRAIGAECDPETYRKAVKRLSAGYTPRLFADVPKPKQGALI